MVCDALNIPRKVDEAADESPIDRNDRGLNLSQMIGTRIIDKIDEMIPDETILGRIDDLIHTSKQTLKMMRNTKK